MSAAPVDLQAQPIALDLIDPSPTNPRRRTSPDDDAKLLESVRKLGVLQPVLVRPKRTKKGVPLDRFELVFGSRRVGAAKAAELPAVPAVVREMNDVEVLEAQLAENAARADVFPLDEAEAYRRLHQDHGVSVEEICAKVGKSRAWVYGRISLLELAAPVRKLLEDGKLDASRALLIRRIPSAKLQLEAAHEILRTAAWNRGEQMTYREARDYIERSFLLRLGNVPWSLEDAALVEAAGPCSTCPKRSGNQTDLFDADEATDLCLDRACFESKQEAHGRTLLEQARATGAKIISRGKSKALFYEHGGLRADSGMVPFDAPWADDPKRRPLRKLLKGVEIERAVAIAPETGQPVELVDVKLARTALVDAGHVFKREVPKWEADQRRARERQKAEQRIETEVQRRVAVDFFEALRTADGAKGSLEIVARALAKNLFGEELERLVTVLGLTPDRAGRVKKYSSDPATVRAVDAWIGAASRGQLFALVGLLALDHPAPDVLKEFQVDRKTIERAVRADVKKLVPVRKKAPASSKRGARKPAPRKKSS